MEVLTIAGVKVENLCKTFFVSDKKLSVLHNLNFTAKENSITVILGRSGCGKTTFLRILGGMETMDQGQIILPENEKTGVVFQEPRLMPWLTVWQNVTFGLKKKEVQKEKISKLLETVGLSGFETAYPSQLSGGMQQRVSLARALAYDPFLILMDEPFAALDHFTRKTMQDELIRIHELSSKEIIFVTHSIDEALILGQKIVIFEEGKVKKEYDLSFVPLTRDLLSIELIEIKKDILKNMKQ